MLAFLKSDLFLRFMGGFVIGTAGMFALQPSNLPALITPALAAATHAAPTTGPADAAL